MIPAACSLRLLHTALTSLGFKGKNARQGSTAGAMPGLGAGSLPFPGNFPV